MGVLVEDPVVVQRHDLRTALAAIDCIEGLEPSEVQALERLSGAVGYEPHIEGSWRERVEG